MDFQRQRHILDIASIIEDQLFFLHNFQAAFNCLNISSQAGEDTNCVFLTKADLDKCDKDMSQVLYSLNLENEDLIGIVMRALCCIKTLDDNVYCSGCPLDVGSLHTTQELDEKICDILSTWTSSSSQVILSHIKDIVKFMTYIGGTLVIPDGVTPTKITCFWCRYVKALDSDAKSDICSHLVVEKSHISQTQVNDENEDDCDFGREEDDLSLFSRINVRQKRRQLREMKLRIQEVKEQYALYASAKKFALSQKQISPLLYSNIGKLIICLTKRLESVDRYSPSQGCLTFEQAIQSIGVANVHACKEKLLCCLKRVSLSPTNMKIIHEKFEELFLDPLSILSSRCSMLRVSMVAKKVLLALHHTPEQIVNNIEERIKFVPFETQKKEPLDHIFHLLVVVEMYNLWLSTQMVDKKHYIKVMRGDFGEITNMGITLLYDFQQIGFQIDEHTRMFGKCEEILDVCLLHLTWLHKKRLCRQDQTIQSLVT